MALFNKDDVSCTDQNKLVSVGGGNSKQSKQKRVAATQNGIVYEPKDTGAPTAADNPPASDKTDEPKPDAAAGGDQDAAAPTAADNPPAGDKTSEPKPDPTTTADHAATCTETGAADAAAPTAADSKPTQTSTTTGPTATATSTSTPKNGKDKTVFAQIAVLYIYQSTGNMAAGTQARQDIAKYLSGGGSGVHSLDLSKAGVNQRVTVDFEKYHVDI